jgi:hypothetical protein
MTGQLHLWALDAAVVRQVFGAPAGLAARLRQVTRDRFPVEAPQPPRFGPLRRHQPVVRLAPDQPAWPDAEALLAGRHIPPDRLAAAWTLLEAWLEDLAPHWSFVRMAPAEAEQADYDLARAGVDPAQGLRALWRRRLDVPLTPLPESALGYVTSAEAIAAAGAWGAHWDQIEGSKQVLGPVHEFLLPHSERGGVDLVAGWRVVPAG